MLTEFTTKQLIARYRAKLCLMDMQSIVVYLRHLDGFESDQVSMNRWGGWWTYTIAELRDALGCHTGVCHVGSVRFRGGPNEVQKFTDDFLTYLVDRTLRILAVDGEKRVEEVLQYAKAFTHA